MSKNKEKVSKTTKATLAGSGVLLGVSMLGGLGAIYDVDQKSQEVSALQASLETYSPQERNIVESTQAKIDHLNDLIDQEARFAIGLPALAGIAFFSMAHAYKFLKDEEASAESKKPVYKVKKVSK